MTKEQRRQLKRIIQPSVWRRRGQAVLDSMLALWKSPLCVLFHRKNHVCWDLLWWKDDGTQLPGNLCWCCNTCKRAWSTRNPRLFESELNPGPEIPGEYAMKVFLERKRQLRHEETVRNEYLRARRKRNAKSNHK